MSYSPIFDAMVEGMESMVQKGNYKLKVITFYEKRDNLEHYLEDLRTTDCVGIILFGTEMREEMVRPFLKLPFPVSYTHLRAHETGRNLVCRLLLEKKKKVCRLLIKKKKNKDRKDVRHKI